MFISVILFYLVISLCLGDKLGPMERNDNLRHIEAEFIAEWQWESWPTKQEKAEKIVPNTVTFDLWSDPKGGGSYWYLYDRKYGRNTDPSLWRYSSLTRSWEKLYPVAEEDNLEIKETPKYQVTPISLPSQKVKSSICAVPYKQQEIKKHKGFPEFDFTFSLWRKPNKILEEAKKENEKLIFMYEQKSSAVWELNNINKTIEKHTKFNDTSSDNCNRNETSQKNETVELKLEPLKMETVKIQNITKKINKTRSKNEKIKMHENKSLKNRTNKIIKIKLEPNIEFLNNSKSSALIRKFKPEVNLNNSLNEVEQIVEFKNSSTFENLTCPNVMEDKHVLSWCHAEEDVIATIDLKTTPLLISLFDLQNKNWTEKPITTKNSIWSYCTEELPIRYVGNGDDMFIFCTPKFNPSTEALNNELSSNYSNQTTVQNETAFVIKLNLNSSTLEEIGEINMKTPRWMNESESFLQIIFVDDQPLLMLAHENNVDLWLLKDGVFRPIHNVWRGSARRWFRNYNSTFYNMNFLVNKNSFQTILKNPRKLKENWTKERGRFIIRILRNENVKKADEDNGNTDESDENLIYSLLQSEAIVNDSVTLDKYDFKLLLFFCFSAIMFSVIGIFIYVRRCFTCPRDLGMQHENKSPPVIRYSVIDDDIFCPGTIIN